MIDESSGNACPGYGTDMETAIVILIVASSVGYVAWKYYKSVKRHMSKDAPTGCDGDCAGCGIVHKEECDDLTPQ